MRSLHSYHTRRSRRFSLRPLSVLVPLVAGICGVAAHAAPVLPQGGQFVAGSGAITQSGTSLVVSQSSLRGVIDWKSFSIGNGASVTVANNGGATMARVTGTDISHIDGRLTANGSFYLVNPQGVVIGTSGVVTTSGRFVASALDAKSADFMTGDDVTFSGGGNGAVINLGKISSIGGDVLLIARTHTENDGSISAPNGSAELATADAVYLRDSTYDPQLYIEPSTSRSGDAVNKGSITAAQIALQSADGNVFALAGNNSAMRATGTSVRDGHVWLVANSGTAHVHDSIYANNADGSGGTVETSGNALHLDNADIHTGMWDITTPVFNVGPSTAATLLKQLNQGTSLTLWGTKADLTLEQTMRWTGDASLFVNSALSVIVGPMATIGNAGAGDLSLRAGGAAPSNGVINRGTIDWSKSTGIVSALYGMNGTWTPGTIRTNKGWSAAPSSGLRTQVTAYKLVNTFDDLLKVQNDMAGTYALGDSLTTDLNDTSQFPVLGQASRTPFTGQFDGMDKIITNWKHNGTAQSDQSADADVGLFWRIGSTGIVRNLNLYVTVDAGNTNLGALAGVNDGLIANVHTDGFVSGTSAKPTGGIVGVNNGTIEKSSSSAYVSGAGPVGAIAGTNSGTIVP
jgi:filamentous hemagglutinin family protein